MKTKDILVVEDEEDQADLLRYSLQKSGYSVDIVGTGGDALSYLDENSPRLVLLDVLLPDTTGFKLLKEIRARTVAPVFMLSACYCSETDRVNGLLLGAQDYLGKSHSHKELLARIRNLLARTTQETDTCTFGGGSQKLSVDLENMCIKWGLQTALLTPIELKLLRRLLKKRGQAVSYRELAVAAWGNEVTVNSMSLKAHITRLRSKLEKLVQKDGVIRSQRKQGYKLLADS